MAAFKRASNQSNNVAPCSRTPGAAAIHFPQARPCHRIITTTLPSSSSLLPLHCRLQGFLITPSTAWLPTNSITIIHHCHHYKTAAIISSSSPATSTQSSDLPSSPTKRQEFPIQASTCHQPPINPPSTPPSTPPSPYHSSLEQPRLSSPPSPTTRQPYPSSQLAARSSAAGRRAGAFAVVSSALAAATARRAATGVRRLLRLVGGTASGSIGAHDACNARCARAAALEGCVGERG